MNVLPQDGWGEAYQFSSSFEFRKGGAQTFLRAFYRMMSNVNEARSIPRTTYFPNI